MLFFGNMAERAEANKKNIGAVSNDVENQTESSGFAPNRSATFRHVLKQYIFISNTQ